MFSFNRTQAILYRFQKRADARREERRVHCAVGGTQPTQQRSVRPFLKSVLACIFSGLLVALCFPGIHTEFISALLPIALVPLFLAVFSIPTGKEKTVKVFCYFWLFGFVIQMLAFFWITQPIIFFSSVPPYIAYPLYVIICILTSLYFPFLFSPLVFHSWYSSKYKNIKIPAFLFACMITFLEIAIPRFFNWSFGSIMYAQTWVSQMSSLFGFNTASPLIFFTNISVAQALLTFQKKPFAKIVFLNLCIWAAVVLFGILRINSFDKILEHTQTTRVAFVQPNFTFNSIASLPLPSQDSQIQSLDRMLEMSQQAVDKSLSKDHVRPNLLVWPESAAPDLFLLTPSQIEKVRQFSAQNHVPVLVQTLQWKRQDVIALGLENAPLWSSSVVVNENGLEPDIFQKWVPMPFGEAFPMERTFPILGKWYRKIFTNPSKLEIGTSYMSLAYDNTHAAAPLICFDSIEQKLPYLQAKEGRASIFVNQANFVWMVQSNAGLEFSMLDRARSIENARSSVLVSNTGPTVAFDPLGRIILPSSTLLTQETGFVDLPVYTGRTLFSYVYNWPLVILGILAIGCYAALLFF